MNHKIIDGIIVERPTREDIYNLTVGDLALNPFGRYARVTNIFAQKDDVHGKAFVCYYVEYGPGSTISNSAKEGEVTPSMAVTQKYMQNQLAPKF